MQPARHLGARATPPAGGRLGAEGDQRVDQPARREVRIDRTTREQPAGTPGMVSSTNHPTASGSVPASNCDAASHGTMNIASIDTDPSATVVWRPTL
jgi:hypothetical protein